MKDNIIEKQLRNNVYTWVEVLFRDKVDKSGVPYINHLITVEKGVNSYKERIVALLHDVIEDTNKTGCDLMIELGIPYDLVKSVERLTRDKNETYSNYINRLLNSDDLIALKVKKADLEHNMDLSRITNPTRKDIDRIEKRYKPAYKKVKEVIERIENI